MADGTGHANEDINDCLCLTAIWIVVQEKRKGFQGKEGGRWIIGREAIGASA